MAKSVPVGARGEMEQTVEFKHTLTAYHPKLPPVYSTPDMIRFSFEGSIVPVSPDCYLPVLPPVEVQRGNVVVHDANP